MALNQILVPAWVNLQLPGGFCRLRPCIRALPRRISTARAPPLAPDRVFG